MSGLVQASMILLVLGYRFRNATESQPTTWWAYALFAYACGAVVFPWLTGGVLREELSVVYSLILGVVFALPMWVASRWLADSPYQIVATVARISVWLWVLHAVIAVSLWVYDKVTRKPQQSA